ncbi:hypothetical protein HUW46_00177 [Amycolatopsis sp. CA-230715]|nr:hypothetical protein HUW46_00177 [Amycolatopsis sp. CA-230715]
MIHALQVDGRAAFRRIAAVLGVSEQTVARRYRRLHGSGFLRVLGRLDPHRQGGTEWLIRVQARPNSARALADTIASYPQAVWVGLTAGGSELVCTVRAPGEDGRNEILLERLPRTAQVLTIRSYAVLHRFDVGQLYWSGYPDLLDSDQVAALAPARATTTPGPLRKGDEVLLHALAADGRRAYADLAAHTNWPRSRVVTRIAELRDSGALYFEVEFSPRIMGFQTTAYLWLNVTPSQLDSTGHALAEHPETAWVAAVAGPENLVAVVIVRTHDELYRYINHRIGALQGVHTTEISLQLHQVKQADSLSNGDRLTALTPTS